jgi:hypothetical protein
MYTLFDVPVTLDVSRDEGKGNPMVRACGTGPEGTRCKTCTHLIAWAYAKTYYKCDKRGDLTHGKATDQRVNWSACSLYEERRKNDRP